MSFTNYKIKANKDRAIFYTSSKDPIAGYKQVEVKDRGTYFHKEVTNMEGVVERVYIKESKFGDTLDVWFKQDSGDINVLSISLWRNAGSLNDYVKEFAKLLPNISFGKQVSLWLNNKTKDSKGFLYKNMYAKSGEDKIEWGIDPTSIPKGEKVLNPITKKEQYSFEKNNAFFYEKLQEGIAKFDLGNPNKHSEQPVIDESVFEHEVVEDSEIPF